jgi:hypothetical protein
VTTPNRTLGIPGQIAVAILVLAGAFVGTGSQLGPVWLLIDTIWLRGATQ